MFEGNSDREDAGITGFHIIDNQGGGLLWKLIYKFSKERYMSKIYIAKSL